VERAAESGVDVFRIFDAMNDVRNLQTAIRATLDAGAHAQGTISYTVSPVHTMDVWVDLAKRIEDLGAHSIAIKDMAGLLKPYVAFELGSRAARDGSHSLVLSSSRTIYDFLSPQLAHLPTEKLFVLTLQSNGALIRLRELSSGSTNQTVASISEILRPVLIDQAVNFIIAHNHPSGNPTPSSADRTLTRNLRKAALTMNLNLLDHLVIGRPLDGSQGYYSFSEEGEL
jgi:DNA repair protein RadC